MASSYSTDLKLELMVTGENAGTWGDKTNTNLNLVQQAIAGVESIALTDGGTVTLVMSDASISNARNMVLKLTGTLTTASELHIPDSIEKFYIIDATAVTGPTNLTIKTVSGTGFTLDQAKIYACYSDGTNITEVSLDTLGGSIGTAGITDAAVTTAKISDNAITTGKISDNQITTAKISDNQITTAKISDNQIVTAKISDNQVTAEKLDDLLTDSGGTAGAYTSASITVDAQGRITAAASGSAGAGGYEPLTAVKGPTSGTYTANAATNRIAVYSWGGGGGGGGGGGSEGTQNWAYAGGEGGLGGFGFAATSVTPPYSTPYSVGGGGSPGPGGPGNSRGNPGGAGGATTLTSIITSNGGGGGQGGRPYGQGTRTPHPAGSTGSTTGTAKQFFQNSTYNTGLGGTPGRANNGGPSRPGSAGGTGGGGGLVVYENIGS